MSVTQDPMAFPAPFDSVQPGMSLRDWYAGQALGSLVANREVTAMASWRMRPAVDLATWAFDVADAMMAEREKRK